MQVVISISQPNLNLPRDFIENKSSRPRRLKLNYNSQPFTPKIEAEFAQLPAKIEAENKQKVDINTTKSTANSQASEDHLESIKNEVFDKKTQNKKSELLVEDDFLDIAVSIVRTRKKEKKTAATKKRAVKSEIKGFETKQKPEILCGICLEPLYVEEKKLMYFNDCFSWFHHDCIGAHTLASINSGEPLVKCPEERCRKEISIEIVSLFLTESGLESYKKKSAIQRALENLDKFAFCTTPDCEHIFSISILNADPKLDCPTCKKDTCSTCRIPFHTNLTCLEYKTYSGDDFAVCAFLEEVNSRKCVKCRFWIEKNEGCNHITCKCGNQFCYLCGATWKTCPCAQE